jgi:hypothetical protein
MQQGISDDYNCHLDSFTNFTQQNYFCQVDISLAGHKIHHIVWNPNVHHRFKNSHPEPAEYSPHNNMLFL